MYHQGQERVIETIDDILKGRYHYWNSNFGADCETFLRKLYTGNELLAPKDVDSLVKMMIKGKSRSMLSHGRYNDSTVQALATLTERHLLTQKQVTAIIPCIRSHKSYQWVDNLLLLGYVLTDAQRDALISAGYTAGIDLILNKGDATITDLNTVCRATTFEISKVEAFLQKFKTIPTLDTVQVLVARLGAIAQYGPGSSLDLGVAIGTLIRHGLPLQVEIVNLLVQYLPLRTPTISGYMERFFSEGVVKRMADFSVAFNHPAHSSVLLSNVHYLLELCARNAIPLDIDCLRGIMTHTMPARRKHIPDGEPMEFNLANYAYMGYVWNAPNVLAEYEQVVRTYLQNTTPEQEMVLLEHASSASDWLVFDIVLRRLNTFSAKCLTNACSVLNPTSHEILRTLFNMKALPSVECLESMPGCDPVTLKLLLENGLPVDIRTIDVALSKGMTITDLAEYGFQSHYELYEICHKYRTYPDVYMAQLKTVVGLHLDVRDHVRGGGDVARGIAMIEACGMEPDYMMYEDAVAGAIQTGMVEYLEREWGMCPNLQALSRISSPDDMRRYLLRVVSHHRLPPEVVTTRAVRRPRVPLPEPSPVPLPEPSPEPSIETPEETPQETPEETPEVKKGAKKGAKKTKAKAKKVVVRGKRGPKPERVEYTD